MAKVIQLKNENGETYYPVTTGDAVKLVDGKTIDEKFGEYGERLEEMDGRLDTQDEKAYLFGYRGDVSSPDVEYSVGTILLVDIIEDSGLFIPGDKINVAVQTNMIAPITSNIRYIGSTKKISTSSSIKGTIPGRWVALSSALNSLKNAALVQRVE